ncbi:hypothetical protein GUITHDRAFT_138932 [Guillardia theta CCMP2712]|uniref:Uncharacterized protein n=1 Tax=Guillardia theta (strain CCMP2712) TaxID=905079 RepID=L1JB84_GUITC|nr:hypothetical protein GUITHDRAFT_138932 [Guillardia theta CCMP2712]EKX45350.1 hypothetical protein GUITHDRAFT_138932 [Guillardia theta CCMP2712]|eukprot:XP_005832330.1 hypothetical protein GUITHDRAFT_138932 [Guillardia theta CCMP2712]
MWPRGVKKDYLIRTVMLFEHKHFSLVHRSPDALEMYVISSPRARQQRAGIEPSSRRLRQSVQMRQQMLGERVGDGSIEVSLDPESIKRGGYIAWVNPAGEEAVPIARFAPPDVTLSARDRRYGAYMVWKNKGEVTCFDGGVPHGCPPEDDGIQNNAAEVVRLSPRDAKRGSSVQWKDIVAQEDQEAEATAKSSSFEPVQIIKHGKAEDHIHSHQRFDLTIHELQQLSVRHTEDTIQQREWALEQDPA